MNLSYDCSPHLFSLPLYGLTQCIHFLRLIGVSKHFSMKKVIEVVIQNQKEWKDKKMTEDALKLLKRLIELTTETMKREKINHEELQIIIDRDIGKTKLCLPDQTATLLPIKDLCIDDNNTISRSNSMKFVHDAISNQDAQLLGVKSKRKQHLNDHTKKRPFRQKEELTDRISRILSGYPCDEGILKELLQNADDANASEIHFVTDFGQHSCDKVFDDKWIPLQGPALLVYNDSVFSDKDIEGIQQLGIGSKGEDRTKIGQYGVGFNAVYHLTDAPSFITRGPNVEAGETLCVMDPHCLYTSPKYEEDTGVMYVDLKDLRDEYSDVFSAYHEETLLSKTGTIFRFPLRTDKMAQNSRLCKKIVDKEYVSLLFEKFKASMFDALLFLKNVRKITISDITNKDLKRKYTVKANISSDDKSNLQEFLFHVNNYSQSATSKGNISEIPFREIIYKVEIDDDENHNESWLVIQRIGFENTKDVPHFVVDAYRNGSLHLLPFGGVALPVVLDSNMVLPRKRGYRDACIAFCFLPLPLTTGLPFQVNGHFFLDHEARRDLWHDKNYNVRSLWNKMVLEMIISPCFSSGLELIKNEILEYQLTHTQEETLHVLDAYHSLFPKVFLAKHDCWNLLIKAIFHKILESEQDVFPSYVYKHSKDSDDTMNVTFIPLKKKSEMFSSVHFTAFQKVYMSSLSPLEKTLKKLGLRTLNLQSWLFDSMKQAGIHVQDATQEYVIKFLKSYQTEKVEYKCRIHIKESGTQIRETNFKNPEALTKLVEFCLKSENFKTYLYGLPLCLTGDLRLRAFSEGQTIFCSDFFQILPKSRHLFLHANLAKLFEKHHVSDMFSPFTIDAFAEYLHDNIDPQIFRTENFVPYATESAEIPNNTWLIQVWKFLTIQAKANDVLDRSAIKQFFIEKLGPWCLVPCERLKRSCLQGDVIDCENILAPVSYIENLLDVSSFDTFYKSSFEKLQLPYINFSTQLPYTFLRTVVPTSRYAFEVLNCLHAQRHIIENCQLDIADCNKILLYLSNNIRDIYSAGSETVIVQMVKALKLHVTIQEQRISLGHRKGLVLPNGIPSEGILQWATRSNIELIQEKAGLIPLYELLAYDTISAEKFYSEHLLQNFSLLPSQYYLKHISFIKDNLLLNSFNEYNIKKHYFLINVLKTVPFIEKTNGIFRLVSNFYSPHNALFSEMCEDFLLPPDPYSKLEWKHFLECLGMQTNVTNDMFLKFAQTVEAMGTKHISQKQRKVSHLLTKELATQIQMPESDFLERVCTIRFLLPYCVDGWRKELHSQFEENTLVCFAGSVLQKYEDLVWTSCTLIPNNTAKIILDKLGCGREPSVQNMIQHLKNICNVLQENCRKYDEENLIDLLSKIYDYLSKHQNENQLQRELCQTPLIFIPDEKKMVTYDKIIIDLQDSDVIKPYLYRAPCDFGRYFHFFEKLGVSRKVACKTYAVILQNMQRDMLYKEFHNNEKIAIQRVVNGFFLQLYKMNGCLEKEHFGVEKLYLPRQEDLALVESTKLIFSDGGRYQNEIKEPRGLFFFIGFEALELQGEHTKIEIVDKLPETVRPQILKKMLNKNLRYQILQPNLGYGNLLQQFINSKEFVEGFMRVVHVANVRKPLNTKLEVNEGVIIANLKQIQIFEVSEIVKTYDFQVSTISSKNMQSYYKEEQSNADRTWQFYAETKPEMSISDWISRIDLRMSELLSICNGNESINQGLVSKILQNIENPAKISAILDDHEVPEYKSSSPIPPRSIFEMPGSFVQPQWHQILDNSFCEFEIGEYVAILLESGYAESDDIYMYAQILKVCNPDIKHTHVQYEVLVGEGQTETRNAFELYKFHRHINGISLDVVPALNIENQNSNETHSPKSLKAIYLEIRKILIAAWKSTEKDRNSIVKRLLKRWHPDKNIGNQEQATEVFKYIRLIISKLENDEGVSLDEDEDNSYRRDGHDHPMWSSFFETFASNINSQCNRERRRYEDYSRNTPGRAYTPVPHPREAKRWYSQACFDVNAAKNLMAKEDSKMYNWICYTCHQGTEKALKAAIYRIDANLVRRIHQLTTLASTLCSNLQRLSRGMENLIGNYNAMRYPMHYHAIPGEFYNRTTAEQAISLCEEILDKVYEQL